MNFQFSILILAIILLIIGTIVLSYSIKSSIKSQKWPPYISNCPDYWLDTTGNGSACKSSNVNISSSGGLCKGIVDFSRFDDCQKYKISNSCGIYWDGINYGNNKLSKICN
jgi:hypothetical protein